LGIDPIPLKTCNWNCVYCQLGRTRRLTTRPSSFEPVEDLVAEIRAGLATSERIDWVTFVGSGEPTLCAEIGCLIAATKEMTFKPVAVITNGSLLCLPAVRHALRQADAVMPTVDAGSQELYRRINRPHSEFSLRRHLDGIAEFRSEYTGNLWVEVMLLEGMNSTCRALEELAAAMEPVAPNAIHLSVPERPPSEAWVRPAREESLTRAQSILGGVAEVLHPVLGEFTFRPGPELPDSIVEVVTRHPMEEAALLRTIAELGPDGSRAKELLSELLASGRVQEVERRGRRFVTAGESEYRGGAT
jgi:wyosine [tRNA(Phe)-imidazoG37] synthetase (radical SAM superfamily)